MIFIPKGTKDVLPQNSYKWHFIENKIRELTDEFGFQEIRTPVFEHTELFLRGVGETTDIVNKEMYTFMDKGNRSMTLKPEGTAGVARSFIENGLANNPMPMKMYYLTPVFRYEKPQSGRLREHHQFGIELYGSYDAKADVEVISLAKTLLNRLGINELELNINNIGCPTCRKDFSKALQDYFGQYKDKLCPTCLERLEKNPLRILDCKVPECIEIAKNAPIVLDYLCNDCQKHNKATQSYLDALGIKYKINPLIVRGLDYYTGTVFEFVSTAIGSQGTVCGGGRYNNLVTEIGGKEMPAVGFGMGLERLIMVMEKANVSFGQENLCKIYIAPIGEEQYKIAFKTVYDLRSNGIIAETDLMNKSVKAQLKYANKIGCEYVVVLGENEVINNKVLLKNMATKEEKEIALDDLLNEIK
ncbi:MAG: histidine--tRNA ligase [Clostridia bacterium]